MDQAVVSIICICHNHKAYLREAVQSALNQTYRATELILVDDNSTDGSKEIIRSIVSENPEIKYKLLENHSGICKAFNEGWKLAKGEYVIDLSADDVLLPGRVEEGIKAFQHADESCGINFTNAAYIDSSGGFIKNHYATGRDGKSTMPVADGYLYPLLLARYFICTPTMMTKREVIEYLGGYDEALEYEDFDFWIRTAKKFNYCYTDKVLVNKRVLKNSFSGKQYTPGSGILVSTLWVCRKAEKINENESDRKALMIRVKYEFRKSLFSGNRETAKGFLDIIKRNCRPKGMYFYDLLLYKVTKLLS